MESRPHRSAPLIYAVLAWLAAINVATWHAFAHDKRQAIMGGWRVPEANLLLLALLGGWPAAKAAQRLLRHKTRKQPFVSELRFAIALNLVVSALLAIPPVRHAAVDLIASTLPDHGARTRAEPRTIPIRFGPGS